MSDVHPADSYANALGVIAGFFGQRPNEHNRDLNRMAAALIARLASHDPPILLAYPAELKENA